jgi:hypothetical protein
MNSNMNKTVLGLVAAIVVVGGGWYLYSHNNSTQGEAAQAPSTSAQATSAGDNTAANADAAGSVKPDPVLVGSENLQGKWQANDDKKFVREFKADGTVTDWYDNETKSSGTYKVFTKANLNGVSVSFPLELNAAYVQLKEGGSESTTMNFKVTMSPDANTLTFTYMDRGGATTYTRIK